MRHFCRGGTAQVRIDPGSCSLENIRRSEIDRGDDPAKKRWTM